MAPLHVQKCGSLWVGNLAVTTIHVAFVLVARGVSAAVRVSTVEVCMWLTDGLSCQVVQPKIAVEVPAANC